MVVTKNDKGLVTKSNKALIILANFFNKSIVLKSSVIRVLLRGIIYLPLFNNSRYLIYQLSDCRALD